MKKLFTLKLSLLFVLLAVAVLPGRGQIIIAQEKGYINGWNDGLSNNSGNYQNIGQTFQAGTTTSIATIEFYVAMVNSPGNVNIEFYSCSSDNSWGSLLNTKTAVPVTATGWVTADVSALNVQVVSGNYYGFKLIPQNGLIAGMGVNSNYYPNGQSYIVTSGGYDAFDIGEDYPFSITGSSTLPVTLTSFTAQKQNNNILLQWSTAFEQNSKDFTLQHSIDGNNWSKTAVLPAAGNSSAIRNYSYVHTSPATGNNYYRLLQTDIDGKSNYTEVRTVKFGASEPGFTVLANPVSNGMLRVHVNNTTVLSLYSSDGRLLWKKQLNAGVQSVDMSGCGKGIFLLKGDGAAEKVLVK